MHSNVKVEITAIHSAVIINIFLLMREYLLSYVSSRIILSL